jgi:hypothetical protein
MTTPAQNPIQIAVLSHGFVYVGRCEVQDGFLIITGAQNIRRWGTTKGLGQLAATGPTEKSVIDPAGTVHANLSALVHLIDCNPAAWPALAAQAA